VKPWPWLTGKVQEILGRQIATGAEAERWNRLAQFQRGQLSTQISQTRQQVVSEIRQTPAYVRPYLHEYARQVIDALDKGLMDQAQSIYERMDPRLASIQEFTIRSQEVGYEKAKREREENLAKQNQGILQQLEELLIPKWEDLRAELDRVVDGLAGLADPIVRRVGELIGNAVLQIIEGEIERWITALETEVESMDEAMAIW